TFPAVIRSKSSQYTSYYYAGDFADAEVNDKWSNYYGFAKFKKALPLSSKGDNNTFYWKCYVPLMTKIVSDVKAQKEKTIVADGEIRYNAKTSGAAFFVQTDGEWKEFFAKGVNIGSSVPGKWFTEFSRDERLYSEWLEKIGEIHANSVRIYTLLPPQFYRAFVHYNETHPDAPLWLYQEMWPEEYPEGGDYLEASYEKAYTDEIKNVIDAMHGQANIPERRGRAFGIYTADVSPYIAGYLVGRELEPEEVISTNEKNPDYLYLGKYIEGAVSASPCEAWLAMNCDYAVEYETETYRWQHPVGIVSWPTLDPKEHDSEWNATGNKELEYNDKVSVDINQIVTKPDLKTGFFGAYHIYPNYPDFMNNEQSYAKYTDEQGSFRYGGYLQEFIAGHKKYPALVAEFGIATGMGNAHTNPNGYNHGGLTEQQQGEGIVRMFSAIKKEGYAGGLIFEWTDEWAKKTWTTEPYIVPFDRNPLWHNGVDPEQNYGILAMESAGPKSEPYEIAGEGLIKSIKLTADETYLGIKIELKREADFKTEDLIVGLDTYDRKSGDSKYAAAISQTAATGLEFTIVLSDEKNAKLLAHPGYNVTKGTYASYPSATGIFEPMSILINKERVTRSGQKIAALYEDQSGLRYGPLENNSHNHWMVKGNVVTLRIPWTRINVADPSSLRVLCDTRENVLMAGPLQTAVTEGIMVGAIAYESGTGQVLGNAGNGVQKPFGWEPWDIPDYKERLKDSYSIIREYFVQDR
ncbi:MAG: hypothetical protein PHQ50_06715, partial [Eubacteriales bacterium]|nr:hypothetical protein [Eubacteriales bacterium]